MSEREPKINFKDELVLRIIWELKISSYEPISFRDILRELQNAKEEYFQKTKETIQIGSTSTSVINNSLNKLKKAGYITKEPRKSRSIIPIKESILPPIIRISKNNS